MKHYYIKDNRIWMANEKMPVITNQNNNSLVYGDTYIRRWLSSLQPCEISESELENIQSYVFVYFENQTEPTEVTDIISDNNGVITFKEKQVDGEIEAVDENVIEFIKGCFQCYVGGISGNLEKFINESKYKIVDK